MTEANVFKYWPQIASEEEFVAFVIEHFDAAYYLQSYNDVGTAGIDPLEHWLNYGLAEERQISRFVFLRYGKTARRSSNRIWKHFQWRGGDIAVRITKPMPPEIMTQIFNQARHESAIVAAGADAIENLTQQDRENVHIDVSELLRAIPNRTDSLLLVPELSASKNQELTGYLVAALTQLGFRSIQTIVTDQESSEVLDQVPTGLFKSANVTFWQDFWIHGPEAVQLSQLAQLTMSLQPRRTIAVNSYRGYEMVAQFGRALSERTRMHCIYTDGAQDDDRAARLMRRIYPFADVLTDDHLLAAELRKQSGESPHCGVVELPPQSSAAFLDAVAAVLGQT